MTGQAQRDAEYAEMSEQMREQDEAELIDLRRRIALLAEEMDSNGMWTVQKSVVRRILDLPRHIEVVEPPLPWTPATTA